MKKVLLLLVTIVFINCATNEETEILQEASVIGRWHLDGFKENVMYEFTANKRYTIYGSKGNFESLQEVLVSGRKGNDWWFEREGVAVDLNFGNTSTLTPNFKCNNKVIEWKDASKSMHSIFFKEGYDLSTCRE